MTTIPDSIKAQLDADWTAAGGAEPTYFVSEDFRTNPPLGKDGLWIPTETLKTDVRPVNDTYANHNHTIDLIVNTTTSEDRLKELSDEVVRILNATAIASMTYQRITNRKRVSGDYNGIWVYQEIITVDMREQMATSAAAYGAGAGTNLDDLLMYGSAHAAYVPCAYEDAYPVGKAQHVAVEIRNTDNTDVMMTFSCPLPTVKGSLKLYLTNLRVSLQDADANNLLDYAIVYGVSTSATTALKTDDTDRIAAGEYISAISPAVDASSYNSITVKLYAVVDTGAAFGLTGVEIEGYYDT